MKVIYYSVKTAQAKIHYLLRAITHHFAQKEKIQIIAPDEKALTFLDNLLWTQPKESFLPHSVSSVVPFHDLIYLCLQNDASDEFPYVFNLTSSPYPASSTVKTLYELEDCSRPEKKSVFQVKFKHYQSLGYPLSIGSLSF